LDLPGHESYLHTTLYGMSYSKPHIALIMIEGTRGIQKMTKEHIIIAIYLRIPIVLAITKIDITPIKKLKQLSHQIKKMFKNVGKNTYFVLNEYDIDIAINNISENFTSVFQLSNVKGNDINPPFKYIKTFLYKLQIDKEIVSKNDNVLFIIDRSYRSKGYPYIISGFMQNGMCNINDKLFLGPVNNKYIEVTVRTIHDDDKNNISHIKKNELGCIAIKLKDTSIIQSKNFIKSGMILSSIKSKLTYSFIAKIIIFTNHSTTIKKGFNTTIHCGSVKKTVIIEDIYKKDGTNIDYIRGGDSNIYAKFRFMLNTAQFIELNEIFIFRENNTRGSGIIIELL
jgi:elongation factor 1-alpha